MKLTRYGICALWLLSVWGIPTPAFSLEEVRLQLKWTHQFQFAGYYAAQEQGYYREAGLKVDIIEARPGLAPLQEVLRGRAEYGVGNSGLLLARFAGDPVVVLAVILQHSPFVLLTRQESAIQSIQDLAGKRLMIEPQADDIVTYLIHEGIPLDNVERVTHSHSIQDFISGRVDAMSAYSTDEPYLLQREGIKFNAYSPRSAGIDFYGDNLFTTEDELRKHPERVKKFREASLRGWHYAMDHQQELVELILQKYSRIRDRDHLAFEAHQMQLLMHPELIDIGYMLEGRWRHIANTYASLGMLPDNVSLKGFLYDANPQRDYSWLFAGFAITLLILTIVVAVNLRFTRLNRELMNLLQIKSQFANIGESVNNIAHQWKQPLNELGMQLMRIEQLSNTASLPDNSVNEIKRVADKGHNLLEFMANTVDAFGHVLKTGTSSSDFSPRDIINEVLFLIRDGFEFHQIAINYTPGPETLIHGNSTEFSHIILSILNNARDIIIERHIESPQITIKTAIQSDMFHLEIGDNAGGIRTEPVKRIFHLGFSDKLSPDTGVGLYIAKKIIEERFAGSIEAVNSTYGALFTITIPLAPLPHN